MNIVGSKTLFNLLDSRLRIFGYVVDLFEGLFSGYSGFPPSRVPRVACAYCQVLLKSNNKPVYYLAWKGCKDFETAIPKVSKQRHAWVLEKKCWCDEKWKVDWNWLWTVKFFPIISNVISSQNVINTFTFQPVKIIFNLKWKPSLMWTISGIRPDRKSAVYSAPVLASVINKSIVLMHAWDLRKSCFYLSKGS